MADGLKGRQRDDDLRGRQDQKSGVPFRQRIADVPQSKNVEDRRQPRRPPPEVRLPRSSEALAVERRVRQAESRKLDKPRKRK